MIVLPSYNLKANKILIIYVVSFVILNQNRVKLKLKIWNILIVVILKYFPEGFLRNRKQDTKI